MMVANQHFCHTGSSAWVGVVYAHSNATCGSCSNKTRLQAGTDLFWRHPMAELGGIILLVFGWALLMASVRAELKRYHRDVTAWADTRGWTCRKGPHGRTWRTSLPRGTNHNVQLQVDGTRSGHAFTLMYVRSVQCIPGGP